MGTISDALMQRTFYSIDAALQQEGTRFYARILVRPFHHLRIPPLYVEEELSVADVNSLSELFGGEFHIPLSTGCYSGYPGDGITRCLLYAINDRGRNAQLHIRRTPLSPWLAEEFDPLTEQFITELNRRALMERMNLVICGQSGAGKTRFAVCYVLPHLHDGFMYVETIPELREQLERQYPPPRYIYVSIMPCGLSGGTGTSLSHAVQYARSAAVPAVIFQEAHTIGTGYARRDDIQALVSSGVPVIFTAHQVLPSEEETALYYLEQYGLRGGQSLVIILRPKRVSYVFASGTTVLTIYQKREESTYSITSMSLPSSLNNLLG